MAKMDRTVGSLPPHAALLWGCVAARDAQEAYTAIESALAASPVDWPACARMSIRHGLASVVADYLRSFEADPRIPAEVAACFARMYRANARRNRALFDACGSLLCGFRQAGIPCLVLKGVSLALTVYPDPALRNFADIDLLVSPADLDRASAVAALLGFAPAHSETDNCVLHRTFVSRCEEDILTDTLPLEYEQSALRARVERHRHRVVVEIHQGLFRDSAGLIRRVDSAPLWRSPRPARLPDGTPMSLPSHEVQLLHLAVHAADHGFARLIFFHDIAATIRHAEAEIDWDLLLDLAWRYEVHGHVYRCLEFVDRECGAPVPAHVLMALAGHIRRRVRLLQRADILSAERESSSGMVLQRLLLEPDWRAFTGALRNILFPPPVIMRRLYGIHHPLMLALFYLLRPMLLTEHLVRLMLHRVVRRG